MRITEKTAMEIVDLLEDIKDEIFDKAGSNYPYAEWEKKRETVKQRLRDLPEYVEKAAGSIVFEKQGRGRPKKVGIVRRTLLFLFARLMGKSNRDVEDLLGMFEPLFGVMVSYKYIERLYSDEQVKTVLYNLFVLLLDERGVSGDFSGDGTGYSVTVSRHYRSNPGKQGCGFLYVFRVIDVDTGLYVAFGYSNRSEMDAFYKSVDMLKGLGFKVDSLSLDRYFSSRKVIRLFGRETSLFLFPKSNIVNFGVEWTRIFKRMVSDPYLFLRCYYLRNLSETGFSSDKSRFGGVIRQRREDRREMACFSIAVLHNIFTVRVRPG